MSLGRVAWFCLSLLAQSYAQEAHCELAEHRSASLAQLKTRIQEAKSSSAAAPCISPGLKSVTLLVHCRQTKEICELRRPLIQSYAPFFREVRWLLSWPNSTEQLRATEHLCHQPGDPYLCVTKVARMLEGSSDNAAPAGLLYMHFDAALAPCPFGRLFDPRKIGTFGLRSQLRWATFGTLDVCNKPGYEYMGCAWHVWDYNRRTFFDARDELQQKLSLTDLSEGCWWGFNDFFYLPREAFGTYASLAEVFANHNVYHEIAGPTSLVLTKNLTGLEIQDFQCKVGVRVPLTVEMVAAPDFVCGHEVHYQDEGMVKAVQAIIDGKDTRLIVESQEAQTQSLDWSRWGEAPASLIFLLALVAFRWLRARDVSRVVLSYLVCGLYVFISVVIDLSMAVQSKHAPRDRDYRFEPMCAVLLTEFLKLLASLCLAWHEHAACAGEAVEWLPCASDVMWLSVPAMVFTFNNILVWWAVGNNDIASFGVFRDTMILWTAILWRLVFGTALGPVRLQAIGIVVIGLVFNQLRNLLNSTWSWSLLLVLSMTACNALGSVANEFALKRKDKMDINVQNAILYTAGVLFTALLILTSGSGEMLYRRGFFHGFTRHTMFTISMQAVVGLTVSRILKYSDAVQKNIAACLRGPILVIISPAFVQSSADAITLVSAGIVAFGCAIYLCQGPLTTGTRAADQNTKTAS